MWLCFLTAFRAIMKQANLLDKLGRVVRSHANPFGTGRIFPPAALRSADGAPHQLRNRALLAKNPLPPAKRGNERHARAQSNRIVSIYCPPQVFESSPFRGGGAPQSARD